MKEPKPICSLSLDLDNKWSYLKTHGDAEWKTFPSYLDLVVPRFLKVLDQFGWKITVFVVGQDAALGKNREALQMIAAAGHEIGNHSFNHEPWLHLYSRHQIEDEIEQAEVAIGAVTDQRPRGFRGPGYSLSSDVLEVLAERDYLYDASTLPTFIGPLARAYYFMTSRFSPQERQQRQVLFGGLKDGLRPIRPYLWKTERHDLLEIPVTTLPVFRIPIHFSYLLYLCTFSKSLSIFYFKSTLRMCRLSGTRPSLLLHPLDFLGFDDVSDLGFFPAMDLEGSKKTNLLITFLSLLAQSFKIASMREHAELALNTGRLTTRDIG